MRDFYRELGRIISQKRKGTHLNQAALGAKVGLSRTSITNIECGRQQVALHMLYELANALGIEPQDLLPAKKFVQREKVLRLDQRHVSHEMAHTLEELYSQLTTRGGEGKEKKDASHN